MLPIATLFRPNVHRTTTSGRRLAALVAEHGATPETKYYSNGRETRSSDLSYDLANAAELWDSSAAMTGLRPALAPSSP